MKAFYDSQVKSFEMKNESFLIKEKTEIKIANKILSLLRVSRRRIGFFPALLVTGKFAFIRITQHH